MSRRTSRPDDLFLTRMCLAKLKQPRFWCCRSHIFWKRSSQACTVSQLWARHEKLLGKRDLAFYSCPQALEFTNAYGCVRITAIIHVCNKKWRDESFPSCQALPMIQHTNCYPPVGKHARHQQRKHQLANQPISKTWSPSAAGPVKSQNHVQSFSARENTQVRAWAQK